MVTSLMTLSQEKPGGSGFNNKTATLKASKPFLFFCFYLFLTFASWQYYFFIKLDCVTYYYFFNLFLCTVYF